MKRNSQSPGIRLIETIWLHALSEGGSLPMPTRERLNAIKLLADDYRAKDQEGDP